ncbi:unnamed protein product [Onchocerca ochengi]|uniref:Protein kinase domain-containing protein n=1 Tax=Onchocerca ochengi TaxID=42157 RepID=A0A182EK43_ONCOC|nr:unnamed protein product [Onchocerca ochengi]
MRVFECNLISKFQSNRLAEAGSRSMASLYRLSGSEAWPAFTGYPDHPHEAWWGLASSYIILPKLTKVS